MSAYSRDSLSVEAYLVRLLAAICRQNGGTIRVKGELIDTVGDATALMKSWDAKTQELILMVSMGTFSEVYRVTPERQATNVVTAPTNTDTIPDRAVSGSRPPMDDEKLRDLERTLDKRRIASLLKDELKRRQQTPEA